MTKHRESSDSAIFMRAVALECGDGAAVPCVSVKGEQFFADRIVEIARLYGVPVVERDGLSRALSLLDTDQPIPQHLYSLVAALLVELEQRTAR